MIVVGRLDGEALFCSLHVGTACEGCSCLLCCYVDGEGVGAGIGGKIRRGITWVCLGDI